MENTIMLSFLIKRTLMPCLPVVYRCHYAALFKDMSVLLRSQLFG